MYGDSRRLLKVFRRHILVKMTQRRTWTLGLQSEDKQSIAKKRDAQPTERPTSRSGTVGSPSAQ